MLPRARLALRPAELPAASRARTRCVALSHPGCGASWRQDVPRQ